MAKKLSEYKNEEAAAILADILDPAFELISDNELKNALKESKINAAKFALKNHGRALIDILAIYEGIPREEYNVNAVGIIAKAFSILNDKDLMSAFTSQEQTADG